MLLSDQYCVFKPPNRYFHNESADLYHALILNSAKLIFNPLQIILAEVMLKI